MRPRAETSGSSRDRGNLVVAKTGVNCNIVGNSTSADGEIDLSSNEVGSDLDNSFVLLENPLVVFYGGQLVSSSAEIVEETQFTSLKIAIHIIPLVVPAMRDLVDSSIA